MLKYLAAGHEKGVGNLPYLEDVLKLEENPVLYS